MLDQSGDCLDRLKFCPAVAAPGLDDCTLSVLPCLVRVEVGAAEIAAVEPVRARPGQRGRPGFRRAPRHGCAASPRRP